MLRLLYEGAMRLFLKYRYCRLQNAMRQMRDLFIRDAERFLVERKLLSKEETINTLAQQWPEYSARYFDVSSPHTFYNAWVKEMGASNIGQNIFDQFSRPYILAGMNRYLGSGHTFSGTILDFGCGTGAIALSWQRKCARNANLLLADVDNLPREFVAWQCELYSHYAATLVDVALNTIDNGSLDCVLCVHVLEHLENPSAVFMHIDKKKKKGGLCIIEAPWGRHPEHLEKAPIDWRTCGGKEVLKRKYICLRKMMPFIPLSGVYRKMK